MSRESVAIQKLRNGQPNNLGSFSVSIEAEFFIKNKFLISSVNTKTFIATLVQSNPLNFVSGLPVDLNKKLQNYNRKEFHHLMPRAFLRSSSQDIPNENALANFCFISRSDNREIGGVAPSEYKEKMATNIDEILDSHICPNALFDDKYNEFTNVRADMLVRKARELCKIDN